MYSQNISNDTVVRVFHNSPLLDLYGFIQLVSYFFLRKTENIGDITSIANGNDIPGIRVSI